MLSVLNRSLNIYLENAGRSMPNKITIHKNTEFTEDEVLGALDAFPNNTDVELVQVVKNNDLNGFRYDKGKDWKASSWPMIRGSYLPISGNEALLWVQGGVEDINLQKKSQPVYKDAALKPTPSPILLRRFTGSGGWYDTCSGVLGLTKMDWNNNTLYKNLPITLVYSKRFADIIKVNPNLVDKVYDFRFFM